MLFQLPERGNKVESMTSSPFTSGETIRDAQPSVGGPRLSTESAALIRRTITRPLSDDEHALFLETCERSGLDPFARHIYPIRDGGKLSIEATIDGLRLVAERTGKYAGQIGPEWCGPDGEWRDIWTSAEPPTAARVGILRSDFAQPIWGKALYAEFAPRDHRGNIVPFWLKMSNGMIAKCAEALGFRRAFPREFSGIYTREEMAQSKVVSISGSEPGSSLRQPELIPDHASGVTSLPRSVPVPLRVFVNRGIGDRRNVANAFQFLRQELFRAAGEAGDATYRRMHLRLPRTFLTREECREAHIKLWLEMWQAVLDARKAIASGEENGKQGPDVGGMEAA